MVKVAVLGGSRNCGREFVVQALEKGQHEFKLLLRNPDNAEYTEEQKSNFTIIQGDALDPKAVRETIEGTDVIVFSIGSALDLKKFSLVAPNVCTDAMKVLVDVLKEMDEKPKRLVAVSSTGLDEVSEVPLLLRPFYHYVLHQPHMDKRGMEKLVVESESVPDYIIVRPSLLTNGKVTGKYRTGEAHVSGYTISRSDVGHFILDQCIEPTTWINKNVILTY